MPRHALPGSHRSGSLLRGTVAKERPDDTPLGLIGVVPYLAVLTVVAAGLYIAWHQGSAGGGRGGVVAGAALLVAAVARLLLPRKVAGLLASRGRVSDVVTLMIFGAGLLIAGLVLPR
jgi:hypothetical protein